MQVILAGGGSCSRSAAPELTVTELAALLQRIRGRPAFDAPAHQAFADLPMTEIQAALTRAEAESPAAHVPGATA